MRREDNTAVPDVSDESDVSRASRGSIVSGVSRVSRRSKESGGSDASWWKRFDQFQRKHRAAGFPIGVVYKFGDDQGNYLAALLTYYAFLAIFPLLLLASTILGFVLQGDPDLQQEI